MGDYQSRRGFQAEMPRLRQTSHAAPQTGGKKYAWIYKKLLTIESCVAIIVLRE